MTKKTTEKENRQKNTTSEDFDNIMLQAIDETLSMLGEKPKTAIYAYLKKKYFIEKKDMPQRIGEVSKALEELLKIGATQLEILFMKNLFIQLKKTRGDFFYEWTACNVTFQEYTQFMKQKYTKRTCPEFKSGSC
ncbi:MAG: hypothetical protein NWF01_05005 [Candidatus Bathyarchaeota archaeon]|nr:hypothetical protein [Candidatus Bathyarchaeota archaeon]